MGYESGVSGLGFGLVWWGSCQGRVSGWFFGLVLDWVFGFRCGGGLLSSGVWCGVQIWVSG